MKEITIHALKAIVHAHLADSPVAFKIRTHKCYVRRPPFTHADLIIETRAQTAQRDGVNVRGNVETLFDKLVESLKDTLIDMTFARQEMVIICGRAKLDCNVATEPPPKFPTRTHRRKTD